ncbi:pyruvate formate lyase family protein, partial [Vibrio harveyi]
VILLEASIRHIHRYAELAENMSQATDNEQRKQELIQIAAISRKIATEAPDGFYEACQLFWYMNIILQYDS